MGIAKEKMKLSSYDSLFGNTENVSLIPISELHSFKNHPFKVVDDDKMAELVESIKDNGILVPVTARSVSNGEYELISGHRRKFACEKLGFETIPVIIKNISDDEATIMMVDSNIQRDELLPSEKAFSYKMKLEAIKRRAGRPSKNSAQVEQNKTSVEIVADDVGESRANIQRYIRLTYLVEDLIEMTDNKKLPLNVAVILSFLPVNEQSIVVDTILDTQIYPSIAQAQKIREYSENKKLSVGVVDLIFKDESKKNKSVSLKLDSDEIKKYFPPESSKKDIKTAILKLLDKYSDEIYKD